MAARFKPTDIVGLAPKYVNFVIEYCKDFAPRRAAEASGFAADTGYTLVQREDIQDAVNFILTRRIEASHIDAEWVLMEAVDNHMIARQQGNISASNTCLSLIAKHCFVDAMAANKMEMAVSTDKEVVERLRRGRKRVAEHMGVPVEEEDTAKVSFL